MFYMILVPRHSHKNWSVEVALILGAVRIAVDVVRNSADQLAPNLFQCTTWQAGLLRRLAKADVGACTDSYSE